MQSIERIGFHESSLVSSYHLEDTITLVIQGVHVEGHVRDVSIRVTGIETILRDGVKVGEFVAECEDGEILTLEYSHTSLYMIIEWTDFKSHMGHTHSYRIVCTSFQIEIL